MTRSKKINWKKRLTNKVWLVGAASGVILAIQTIAPLLGISFNGGKAMDVFNALLVAGVALGIIVDPTTPGFKDGDK